MAKKLMSLVLALVMCLSLCVPAFAVESQNAANEETVLCTDALSSGGESTVTSRDNDDGSTTYTYYENGVEIRTYNVIPGSGYYTVQDSANNTSATQIPHEKTVHVGTSEQAIPQQAALRASSYKYWGTASYYNPYMGETYSVRCTIKEDVNNYGSFSPVGYYAEKSGFIASVIAFFYCPEKSFLEKAADEIFENAVEKAFFTQVVVASGVIQYVVKKAFTVDATYTQYHIHGVNPSGNATGVFQSDDGYIATVHADQGLFSQKTYSGIWTKNDWRNPTLGRLLFWNVYGNEYTPTSWS